MPFWISFFNFEIRFEFYFEYRFTALTGTYMNSIDGNHNGSVFQTFSDTCILRLSKKMNERLCHTIFADIFVTQLNTFVICQRIFWLLNHKYTSKKIQLWPPDKLKAFTSHIHPMISGRRFCMPFCYFFLLHQKAKKYIFITTQHKWSHVVRLI